MANPFETNTDLPGTGDDVRHRLLAVDPLLRS